MKSYILKYVLTGLLVLVFANPAMSDTSKDLSNTKYYGYKIVHHMTAEVDYLDNFGFNRFDHPRLADYRPFVNSIHPTGHLFIYLSIYLFTMAILIRYCLSVY